MKLHNKLVTTRVFSLLGLLSFLTVPALYAAKCGDGSTPLTALSFHFSGDSYRPGSNCGAASCTDRLVMGGSGTIHGSFCPGQTVTRGQLTAEGSFAHYDISLPAGQNIPLQFTGTWKSTSMVSFQLLGVYGTDSQGRSPLAGGVLVMNIVLVRPSTVAIPLTRVPSLLTLVSNLQPAGLTSSGQADGVTLIAPNPGGYLFEPIPVESFPVIPGGLGTAEAHTPVLFTTLNEERAQPPAGMKAHDSEE